MLFITTFLLEKLDFHKIDKEKEKVTETNNYLVELALF